MRLYLLTLILLTSVLALARAEIRLIAVGKIPGNAIDASGLNDTLADGTPHNRLGGFGSAIAHVRGNQFLFLPDRGPKDGASTYQCRFHFADVRIVGDQIHFDLRETVILRTPDDQPYLGDQNNGSRQLDPEGVCRSPAGTIFVSDEYGPRILEFSQKGRQLREFKAPVKFVSDAKEQPSKRGRVANRGLEGLAITPSGKLLASLQGPLVQDGGRDGCNIRMLELNPKTGATRELVYPLESSKNGISELLAIGDADFLVLERDGSAAPDRFCSIFRINTSHASDISSLDHLPASGPVNGVTPVAKSLFLDLTRQHLALPEKVEGLCFGPDFAAGRRVLMVTTDNDYEAGQPTQIYAFSVDANDLK
jgi:hypothetical protein